MTADNERRHRNAVGATGRQVGENLKRLRLARGLSTRELAEELRQHGRPIPATGITRIEKGARSVDVDDLFTLAVVLDVSPLTLLLPPTSGDVVAEATSTGSLPTWKLWNWGRVMEPIKEPFSEADYADFQLHAAPKGVSKYIRRGERTEQELAQVSVDMARVTEARRYINER